MESFVIFGLFCILAVSSVPVDPFDEVEFVEPTNTNTGDPEFPLGGFLPGVSQVGGEEGEIGGGFPIIIVRTSGGAPFGGFPFDNRSPFGGFPFHSQFPDEVTQVDSEIPVPGLSSILKSIFGTPHVPREDEVIEKNSEAEEGEEGDRKNCGLICTLVGDLHKIHEMVEDEIKDVHQKEQDRENEIEGSEDDKLFTNEPGSDGNSTYVEEIRPDGTIVRTNRTVVKSPNGVSFVFTQTTSFNNGEGKKDNEEEKKEVPTDVEEEEKEEETDDVRTDNPEEILADDEEKEVLDEFTETPLLADANEAVVEKDGVDGGLLEIVE